MKPNSLICRFRATLILAGWLSPALATTGGLHAQVATPTSDLPHNRPLRLESYATLATATSGAWIQLSLDSAVPMFLDGDPQVPSQTQVLIDRPVVLGLQGFKSGMSPSATAEYWHLVTGLVAAGGTHVHLLRTIATLRAVGSGDGGKLGNGSTNSTQTFITAPSLSDVADVSASITHSLALLQSGGARAWGINTRGALGDGSTTNRTSPVTPNSMSGNVVSVSAGNAYSLFVLSNGTVWGTGINDRSQLGDGTTTNRTSPVRTGTLTNATTAFATPNGQYGFALTTNATLMAWGRNSDGQLGIGNYTSKTTPTPVTTLGNVVMVSMGFSHNLALLSNGSVFTWGSNAYGQLGHGDTTVRNAPVKVATLANITWVSAGSASAMALSSNGTLYTWGKNSDGQLGLGNLTTRHSPTVVGALSDVVFAEMGSDSSYAVTWDGRLFAWGSNSAGQLGDGTVVDRSSPVEIVGESTIYALEDIDNDDLPDRWEEIWINASSTDSLDGLEDLTKTGDYDGDSVTNYNEYLAGSDPSDFYNGLVPLVTIKSGNHQSGAPSAYLANSLVVEVREPTNGSLLTGAPVLFTVAGGGGGLAPQSGNLTPVGNLSLLTSANGTAAAWYRQSGSIGITSTITVTAGQAAPLTFQSTTRPASTVWGRWAFDEASGNIAIESTGQTANGTLLNQVARTSGVDGEGGLSFSGFASQNGTNAYVSMGNPSNGSLDLGTDSFSISVWVQFTEVSVPSGESGRRILGKGHYGGNAGYFIGTNGTGQILAGLGASQGGMAESLVFKTADSINDGLWHHVAVVFDRVAATGRIYVDGHAKPLAKESGTGGELSVVDPAVIRYPVMPYLNATRSDQVFTVGSYAGSNDFFEGEVDELRIYRAALSHEEIGLLYDSEVATPNGLPDRWEWLHFQQLGVDPAGDADQDGLSNYEEYRLATDPNSFSDPEPVPPAGLQLWVRADAGVQVDGQGKVTQWNDQSGVGHHAVQGNVSRSPSVLSSANFTNGKPAILFDGTNDFLGIVDAGNGTTTSNLTVLAVYRLDAGGSGGQYPVTLGGNVNSGNGARVGIEAMSGANATIHTVDLTDANGNGRRLDSESVSGNGIVQIVSASAGSALHSAELRSRGASGITTNLGGNQAFTVRFGMPSGDGAGGIGGRPLQHTTANGTGWVMKGAVAEVVIYDRVLTAAERTQAEQYLLRRYDPLRADADGDGLTREEEEGLGLDPLSADTNGDGLLDGAAYAAGGGFLALSLDFDGDGLSNATELALGLNPWSADSDGDGVNDRLDAYPFDPARSSALSAIPGDTTAPTINLTDPANATLLP